MPKGSVPRDTTASASVKEKKYRALSEAYFNPTPKKPRPSRAEVEKAYGAYADALKYPRAWTGRDPAPEKQWYDKKTRSKAHNVIREGVDIGGHYKKERATAKDVRKAPGYRLKKTTPVGKGGR
jgi:hypothetical protein